MLSPAAQHARDDPRFTQNAFGPDRDYPDAQARQLALQGPGHLFGAVGQGEYPVEKPVL